MSDYSDIQRRIAAMEAEAARQRQEQRRAERAMEQRRLQCTLEGDGFTIRVDDWKSRDCHEAAVNAACALIAGSDTDARVKEGVFDAPHRLYDKVLTTLAKHYAADWPETDGVTLKAVLEAMLSECASREDTELNKLVDEAE